jgi:hypothetical protein
MAAVPAGHVWALHVECAIQQSVVSHVAPAHTILAISVRIVCVAA